MSTTTRTALAFLASTCVSSSALATIYSVGAGTDCSHSQFSSALTAAMTDSSPGPHQIKLETGERVVNNHALSNPVRDLVISGGWARCSDPAPTPGAVTTLRANSANSRVLHLQNAVSNERRGVTFNQVLIKGGHLSTAEGGGLRVDGPLTVTLAKGVVVEQNTAANGGGIHLSSAGTADHQFAQLHLMQGAIVRDNHANTLVTQGYGGGIDCRVGCTVHPWHAEITSNFARLAGGGVALRGPGTRLLSDPAPAHNQWVLIADNVAGLPTDVSGGFGGGIFSDQGDIASQMFAADSNDGYSIHLIGNTANFGGAIAVLGPASGTFRTVNLKGPLVLDNSARQRGGAFYGRNGVTWTIDHDSVGDCRVSSGVRKPCSYLAGNSSTSSTAGAGGAVAYLTVDSGAQPGTATFLRTLFEGNSDAFGMAAVIEAVNGYRLDIRRSVFIDNHAGATSGDRVLIGSTNANIDFHYNTVLDNQVAGLFYMNGGALRPQGSIWWAPGVDLWYPHSGAHMSFVTVCLVTHTVDGLPAAPAMGAWQVDPRIDGRWAPRGGSPAIDHCGISVDPGADLYGRTVMHNVGSMGERIGIVDLGAVEQTDILMYAGFGNRPGN